MIDSRELRIGNLILFNGEQDEVVEIIKDNLNSLKTLIGGRTHYRYMEERTSPIPLTPEILIDFEFESDEGEFRHPDNTDFDLMFFCSENGLWCAYTFGDVKVGQPFDVSHHGVVAIPISNPFKYLHQFQNLYFALTQTELTITLK